MAISTAHVLASTAVISPSHHYHLLQLPRDIMTAIFGYVTFDTFSDVWCTSSAMRRCIARYLVYHCHTVQLDLRHPVNPYVAPDPRDVRLRSLCALPRRVVHLIAKSEASIPFFLALIPHNHTTLRSIHAGTVLRDAEWTQLFRDAATCSLLERFITSNNDPSTGHAPLRVLSHQCTQLQRVNFRIDDAHPNGLTQADAQQIFRSDLILKEIQVENASAATIASLDHQMATLTNITLTYYHSPTAASAVDCIAIYRALTPLLAMATQVTHLTLWHSSLPDDIDLSSVLWILPSSVTSVKMGPLPLIMSAPSLERIFCHRVTFSALHHLLLHVPHVLSVNMNYLIEGMIMDGGTGGVTQRQQQQLKSIGHHVALHELNASHVDASIASSFIVMMSQCRQLRNLSFRQLTFPSWNVPGNIIAALPLLEFLNLADCIVDPIKAAAIDFGASLMAPLPDIIHLPQLKRLSWDSLCIELVARFRCESLTSCTDLEPNNSLSRPVHVDAISRNDPLDHVSDDEEGDDHDNSDDDHENDKDDSGNDGDNHEVAVSTKGTGSAVATAHINIAEATPMMHMVVGPSTIIGTAAAAAAITAASSAPLAVSMESFIASFSVSLAECTIRCVPLWQHMLQLTCNDTIDTIMTTDRLSCIISMPSLTLLNHYDNRLDTRVIVWLLSKAIALKTLILFPAMSSRTINAIARVIPSTLVELKFVTELNGDWDTELEAALVNVLSSVPLLKRIKLAQWTGDFKRCIIAKLPHLADIEWC